MEQHNLGERVPSTTIVCQCRPCWDFVYRIFASLYCLYCLNPLNLLSWTQCWPKVFAKSHSWDHDSSTHLRETKTNKYRNWLFQALCKPRVNKIILLLHSSTCHRHYPSIEILLGPSTNMPTLPCPFTTMPALPKGQCSESHWQGLEEAYNLWVAHWQRNLDKAYNYAGRL